MNRMRVCFGVFVAGCGAAYDLSHDAVPDLAALALKKGYRYAKGGKVVKAKAPAKRRKR